MFGIVTGRDLEAVRRRAADLKFDIVLRQGIDEKLPVVDAIAEELGLTPEAICYVGDDLLDLPAIRAVGLGVAVADAPEEVRRRPATRRASGGRRRGPRSGRSDSEEHRPLGRSSAAVRREI